MSSDPINVGFGRTEPKAIGPNGEMQNRYFLHDTRVGQKETGATFTARSYLTTIRTSCWNI
jgi:hypothetical protein